MDHFFVDNLIFLCPFWSLKIPFIEVAWKIATITHPLFVFHRIKSVIQIFNDMRVEYILITKTEQWLVNSKLNMLKLYSYKQNNPYVYTFLLPELFVKLWQWPTRRHCVPFRHYHVVCAFIHQDLSPMIMLALYTGCARLTCAWFPSYFPMSIRLAPVNGAMLVIIEI